MQTFPLTPIDYVFTGVGSQPITFAFSYNTILDPALLQKSFAQTLEQFPLLSSRLHQVSETDYVFQICDDGVTFDVLESNVNFKDARYIEQYITPVVSAPDNPLTKVTLTQTPAGSVLTVSVAHALVDGFSYFHFFSS